MSFKDLFTKVGNFFQHDDQPDMIDYLVEADNDETKEWHFEEIEEYRNSPTVSKDAYDQAVRTNRFIRGRLAEVSDAYDRLQKEYKVLSERYKTGELNYNRLVEQVKEMEKVINFLRDDNVNLKNLYSKSLNEKINVQERLCAVYAEICEKENSSEDVSET